MELDRQAFLGTFLSEADEALDTAEQALLALEGNADDPEALAAVFRAVHTIKGNAQSLGLCTVAEVSHAAEDVLSRLRQRKEPATPTLVSMLLECVDALRPMIPSEAADRPVAAGDLCARLRALDIRTGAEPAGAQAATHLADRARTLRIDLDKLDRMLDLTGEIAIVRERLRQLLTGTSEAAEVFGTADRLMSDLQDLVLNVRLVPVMSAFRHFARVVRDLATACRKRVELLISGEDVEVDTTVSDVLRNPLLHLLRNAVDHGIESPEVRMSAGKSPAGRVTISARREAGSIVIELSDDGAGFDRGRIAARAMDSKLVTNADDLDDQRLFSLVFQPGFTTAETVTELSGRGVGMDIVRRAVESLQGSVAIDSRPGQGTTVTLCVPLTVAIIDGFTIRVGAEVYVVPMRAVVECVDLPALVSSGDDRRGVMQLRGQPLPFLSLRRFLGVAGEPPARQHVLVIRSDEGVAGLVVDQLLGESEAVIKPLGTMLHGVGCMAGSTIVGNGKVALILDVAMLLRAAQKEWTAAA